MTFPSRFIAVSVRFRFGVRFGVRFRKVKYFFGLKSQDHKRDFFLLLLLLLLFVRSFICFVCASVWQTRKIVIFKLSKLGLFVLLLLLLLVLLLFCCCCLFVAMLMRSVVTLLLLRLQIAAKSLGYSLFSSGQCSIYVASFILTGPNLCGCCTLDIASCNYISIPLSLFVSLLLARWSVMLCLFYAVGPPFSLGSLIDVARINQAIWAARFVWCWSSDLLPKYSHLPLSFPHTHLFRGGNQSIAIVSNWAWVSFVRSIAIASRAPSRLPLTRYALCCCPSPSHTSLLISLGRSRCHTNLG